MSMQQATRRCAMRQSRWHIPPIRLRLCLIVYSTLFLVYKFHGLKSSAALGQLADEPDFFGRAFPANFKLRGAEIHSFPPGTKIFVPSRDPRVQIRILRAHRQSAILTCIWFVREGLSLVQIILYLGGWISTPARRFPAAAAGNIPSILRERCTGEGGSGRTRQAAAPRALRGSGSTAQWPNRCE